MQNSMNMESLIGKKILFASMPADGHVNPLTGLAKYLQSQGCDVRWYTGFSYAPKMAQLNIPLFPFRKALEITAGNLEEYYPERKKIKGQVKKLVFDMINYFIEQAPRFIEDMKDIRKEFPFDIVVAECTFTAIPLVKKELKVPVIGVGIVPLTETSRDLPPAGLGMTPSLSFIGRRKQQFLRFFTNEVLFRKANKVTYKILDSYGIKHNRSNMFDIAVKTSDLFTKRYAWF